jgi:hypothetical protein
MNGLKRSIYRIFGVVPAAAPPQPQERNDDVVAVIRDRVETARAMQEAAYEQMKAASHEAHQAAQAAIRLIEGRGAGREHRK